MKKKWKRLLISILIGLLFFVGINIFFIIIPQIVFYILLPGYYLFKTILGGVLYVRVFGSEWTEVLSLSLAYSIILVIISYIIIRKKNV